MNQTNIDAEYYRNNRIAAFGFRDRHTGLGMQLATTVPLVSVLYAMYVFTTTKNPEPWQKGLRLRAVLNIIPLLVPLVDTVVTLWRTQEQRGHFLTFWSHPQSPPLTPHKTDQEEYPQDPSYN